MMPPLTGLKEAFGLGATTMPPLTGLESVLSHDVVAGAAVHCAPAGAGRLFR